MDEKKALNKDLMEGLYQKREIGSHLNKNVKKINAKITWLDYLSKKTYDG